MEGGGEGGVGGGEVARGVRADAGVLWSRGEFDGRSIVLNDD